MAPLLATTNVFNSTENYLKWTELIKVSLSNIIGKYKKNIILEYVVTILSR